MFDAAVALLLCGCHNISSGERSCEKRMKTSGKRKRKVQKKERKRGHSTETRLSSKGKSERQQNFVIQKSDLKMVNDTTIHTMPEEVNCFSANLSLSQLKPVSYSLPRAHTCMLSTGGFLSQVLSIILQMLQPPEKCVAMSVCKRWVTKC